MEVLRLGAPVRWLVGLAISELLLVRLGFVLLLATTKSAEVMRRTFIRPFSTLVLSLSATSSCSTTVSGRQVSQWPNRGYISWANDFSLPARTSRGGCRIFGGRQCKRGWGTVKLRMRMVMCMV